MANFGMRIDAMNEKKKIIKCLHSKKLSDKRRRTKSIRMENSAQELKTSIFDKHFISNSLY